MFSEIIISLVLAQIITPPNTGGGGGGGSGTVTNVSVSSANGFSGTVANPTTTPAISVRTSVTGLLKGNGTAASAAVAGTDYEEPITFNSPLSRSINTITCPTCLLTTNNLSDLASASTARTNLGLGSAAVQNTSAFEVPLTFTSPVTRTSNTISFLGLTSIGSANQVLGVNSAGTSHEYKTITAGSNVSVTHGANSITISSSGGVGTVTDVSVQTANGFAGSVATSTSTPAITLTTSVTGLLKGNGTAMSAAVAGTDYENPLTFNSPLSRATNAISCSTCALTSGKLDQFATTTSAELAGVISNETGSGSLVFGTSPSLTTPSFSSIINTGTLTLPTSTDTLVGRATSDTLTNKILTLPILTSYTVAGLPAGSTGQIAVVSDAASAGSCSSGSGSAKSLCYYDGASWVAIGDGGGGGSGISSLGASGSPQTGSSQTLATGTSGSDFNISSATNTHTFNIPDAGASARGLVTTGSQTMAGAKTFSGAGVFSANAAASTPSLSITGTVFNAGTATTNKAVLLVEPAGTTSTSWSANGVMVGVNAASGFAGRLIDLQVSATSQFFVASNGSATSNSGFLVGNSTLGNGTLTSSSSMTIRSSASAATAGTAVINSFQNSRTITAGTAITNQIASTFAPTSGTGVYHGLHLNDTMNQTSTATGITRGIFLNPTITSSYDYRFLDLAATTVNVLSGSPDQNAVLLNAPTYAAGSSKTITNAATLKVDEPVGGTNVTLTNRYSAWLLGSLRTDKRIQNGVTTVTYSATPTFDLTTGDQLITLTGNVTSSTASNLVAGQRVTFFICQDATGGRTFSWPSNVKGTTTIGGTASTCSVQQFESPDGTNLYALGAGVTNQ